MFSLCRATPSLVLFERRGRLHIKATVCPFLWSGLTPREISRYGALLVPYTRAYSIILGMYSFVFMANTFLPLARLFLSGATFFYRRDFFFLARLFLSGATFFLWCDFFSLARLFFPGATLFSLARLFLSGATFFRRRDFFSPARLFFAGATFFAFSLALICRPLLDFIAGSSYEHVQL